MKYKFSIRTPKFISRLSFQKRITISIVILALMMTLFMGISTFRLSSNIILEMSKQLSENNFDIVYKSLDDYFHRVENYSTLLIRMSPLQDILKKKIYRYRENMKSSIELNNETREIMNLALFNDDITFNTVNIYCKNGFNYSYFNNQNLPYTDYESCIQYYIDNGYISSGYKPSSWCDVTTTSDMLGRTTFSFINIRILYSAANLDEVGILVTSINEDNLFNIYSSFSDKAYIIHKNGKMISHKDKTLLGSSLGPDPIYKEIMKSSKFRDTLNINIDNKNQLVTYKKLASNDTYFVVPFDYYNGNEILKTNSFIYIIIALILIGFFMSIIFAMLLSKSLSASVLSLKKTVQAVNEGNLDARFVSDRNDEVAYLGKKFNGMLDEINNLFIKQKEQEDITKTLELKLMQSQINPHLLYNTLDSTLWTLDNNNIAQAKELIVSLSEFFKITLSGGSSLIPLYKELELIRNYISIQRVARGKDISLDVKGPENLLKIPFIKLSIQPIVENAILHGFSGYRDDGKITITIMPLDEETVQISIKDNGIGVLEDELANINEMLASYPLDNPKNHFGLYNIQRRIKNMFGSEYGIHMESEVGDFTCVYMKIPIIIDTKEDSNENV